MAEIKMEESWKAVLEKEFSKPYFNEIKQKILREKEKGKKIFPAGDNIFKAFDLCPFSQVKVVLLGQDPYHGLGQAHGLSFSVPDGMKMPPSLQNIFKELKEDVGKELPSTGNLEPWASQGVLLLNAFLTVNQSEPLSHSKFGWDIFTDAVIRVMNEEKYNLVFILWGAFARSKKKLINTSKHLVLEAAHPSPFSSHQGFFGSKPFSKTNEYLRQHGIPEINW